MQKAPKATKNFQTTQKTRKTHKLVGDVTSYPKELAGSTTATVNNMNNLTIYKQRFTSFNKLTTKISLTTPKIL